MLRVDELWKRYRSSSDYTLRDLSFCVKRGQIISLLGHNGAGKSTTLRIIAGISAPSRGRVLVNEAPIHLSSFDGLSTIRRSIGFCPENTDLLEYLTPKEYLHFVGQLYGIDDDALLAARTAHMIDMFGIAAWHDRFIGHCSDGMKKRIAIASAMINSPELLLLDEPANHLDPIGVKILKEHLQELRADGAAILLATHRLELAQALSDAIVVLNQGQTMYQGTLDDLRQDHPGASSGSTLENLYALLLSDQ